MTGVSPPTWTPADLESDRQTALRAFREDRMREPLAAYLESFDTYRKTFIRLLGDTSDLTGLSARATDVTTEPELLEALRYLAGPPISSDDLKILAEATLSPGALLADPSMAKRVVETILLGLDARRFPWVRQRRRPTENERSSAAMASAALMAARQVMTARANESKKAQEDLVKQTLREAGLREVPPRRIDTLVTAPGLGEFCGESMFAGRKADIVIRLWDGRAMPTECKVSNSYLNSVKRLNNDAAVKAQQWIREFGSRQTVPAAVLAGAFKIHNLLDAQARGLTLFWSHRLKPMTVFVENTREGD
ncbi:MAG: XamI family restriction endonuclease [Candidatus Dormiibacterota bacterium]